MLDKNPEWPMGNDLTQIKLEAHNPNIILCSKPFHKMEFLHGLINSTKDPVIFVDMDLLYTGYIESEMIQKNENVTIFSPNRTNWREKLSEIICKTSERRSLVIIDSFNGVYSLFGRLESARFVNSCMMLVASIGTQAKSPVVIMAMAKKRDDKWILSPGGKQVIKSENTGLYLLKKNADALVVDTLT